MLRKGGGSGNRYGVLIKVSERRKKRIRGM
jgi:hypothetical protein